jgi:hypothetical protein
VRDDAGVIHQRVDLSKALDYRVNHLAHIDFTSDVGGQRYDVRLNFAKLSQRFVETLHVYVRQRHPGARVAKSPRGVPAYTFSPTGNENHLSFHADPPFEFAACEKRQLAGYRYVMIKK